MVYMQGLIDQFRNQGTDLGTKMKFYFELSFPFKWELHRELGDIYKNMGAFISGFELLNEVELTEDAIKCLFMAGRETQALKLAETYLGDTVQRDAKTERVAKRKTITQSNILCLIGDIKRDGNFYERAWDESGKRCARAMRSLGRMRFYENKFEESVACFNRAFEINRLYPKEWFTCGCAHMRLEQLDKAIFCFGNVVSIDETQTDAWANMANCYAVQGKFTEALACTEQALKEKRADWRIWHNLIKFCIACGQFYRAIFAVNELLRQNQLDGLNGQLLLKISEIFLDKYVDKEDVTLETFLKHKAYLYKFFGDFSNKINDFRVWRLICRIKQVLKEPLPEVAEAKKNEIRSLQKPGWNVELEVVENVERALIELVQMLDPHFSNEEAAFIKTTAVAIEHALQRKCKMENLVEKMAQL